MEKNYDFETKMLRKPLRKTSQNGDHCTVKTFKEAKSHWLPLLLTVALSLLMGQAWAQTTSHTATFNNNQWTVPENAGRIIIDCWGGGGSGASSTGSGDNRQGGGGGGGGFARSLYDITPTSTVKARDVLRKSVGAQANVGADGNASTVYLGATGTNALLSATGGTKGTTSGGGQGGQGSNGNVANKTGGQGGAGFYQRTNIRRGGGGGGAAGYTGSILEPEFMDGGDGLAGSNNTPSGGNGYTAIGCGNSQYTGKGGNGVNNAAGSTGTNYGGGGGGGANNNRGGTGAAGFVQITYFIKHTITLNANSGTLIGESSFGVWEGETYGSALNANVPFYPGHTFDGWFTTGGERVSSTDVPTTNTTLVAHWTEGTAPISLADQVTFPSSTTWIAPEGTWKITSIEAWGGGGGGGGAYRSGSTNYYGGGGGSGAYAKNNILAPQNFHSNPFNITVGAGGAGNSGERGGNGTNSSLSYNGQTYVNAGGGTGGAVSSSDYNTGGAGGEATIGTTKTNGGNGANRARNAGGNGGDAPQGGAGGAGSSNNNPGQQGVAPGGGGGGSFCSNYNNTTKAGGAGGDGQVKIAYEVRRLNVRLVDNYEGGNSKDTIILYYDTITYTPVRDGYVFLGWYNQATGGAKFDFPTSGDYLLYNLTEDDTLYAHWLFLGAISSTPQTLRPCVAGGLTIASASEPDPSLCTYQWRYSYNGAEEVVVSGETEKDLTMDVPSTVGTYVYKRYVSIDGGTSWYQSANSCTVTVVERNAGKISLATAAEIFPCGSYTINNNVTADDVDTYQWRYVDAQGEDTVAEATGSSLTNAPNFTEPGTYKFTRYIASTCGGYLPSDTVTITVTPIPGGTITANPTIIDSRGEYSITGTDAGSQYEYQWAYKTPGASDYMEITGATQQNLTNAPNLVASGDYTFIRYTRIPDCDYEGSSSNAVTIHVNVNGDRKCFDYVNSQPQTWTAPEGTYKVTIEAWGGGGAGGGAYRTGWSSNYTYYYGGGGGSGAYAQNSITAQNFHSKPFSITVGAGGAGHTGNTNSSDNFKGGNGNQSSVNFNNQTYAQAGGGGGGTTTNNNNQGAGQAGAATSTNGSTVTQGNAGGIITNSGGNRYSGKGADAPNAPTDEGKGGAARTNNTGVGNSGTAPGAGGGGARSYNVSATYAGGAGGAGRVCISYEILELQLTTNVNYGGAVNDTNLVLYYDTIPVSNPTRSEYVFLGWYDAPTGGNKVEFEQSGNYYLYNKDIDLNLYAHWKIDSGAIATGNETILPCNAVTVNQTRPATTGSTYKWFYTKDGGNHFIEGATETTLSNFQLTEVGTYTFHRVALNAETGDSLVSDGTYTVTVRDVEGGTIAADPDNIVPGGTYSITSSEAETAQNTSFSWKYKNVDSTGFSTINGATNAELTSNQPTLSSEGKYVFVRTTTYSACATAIVKECSDTIQVKINPGAISGDTTIAPCGEFSIASQTDAQGQSSYKWIYKKQIAATWDTLNNVNAATLSQADVTLNEPATYLFNRLAVNNVGGTTPTAQAVTITVNPISGGTITADSVNIAPRNAYAITGSDQGGQFTYQWAYKKPGESNYTNILGATGKDLSNAPVLSAFGDYSFIRYAYLNDCGDQPLQAASEPVTITVALESHNVCFDTPGEMTTWTAPIGTWKITSLQLWGGGAGGGNATMPHSVGSGGGGGAYLSTSMTAPQNFHATPFNIMVANTVEAETDGDSSIVEFGDRIFKAKGGTKGAMAVALTSGVGENTNTAEQGQGGIAVGGTNGLPGSYATATYTNAIVYSNFSISASGAGGAGANGGAGGQAVNNQTNDAGNEGSFPGGGGGGARNNSESATEYFGGAGASGKVCISYEVRDFQVLTNAHYGDTPQIDTNYVLYYDVVNIPTPTRTGFVFTGWYDVNGTQVTFDSTNNQALYSFTKDTVLYAHWKVDAGAIGINDGRQYICRNEPYTIFGDVPEADHITYSWKCTKWYDDDSQNRTYQIYSIDSNKSSITERDFQITEPGLYVFTRYVQTSDDDLGPQPSANEFKIYVVAPSDTVGGLTSNYDLICEGGKVTLTPDLDKAKIKIPDVDDPTRDTTLASVSVSYEYSVDGGSHWSTYKLENAELEFGNAEIRAVFSYQSLDCKAYSKPVHIEVAKDPVFSTMPSPSMDDNVSICPNESVIFTAGDLSNIDFDSISYPFSYTWTTMSAADGGYVPLGNEATYNLSDNGKVVNASNFISTGELFYFVEANNDLGCNASSIDIGGMVMINVNDVPAPTVTTHVTCPQDGIHNLKDNVTVGGNLLWYENFTTEDAEDNESQFTYSLAEENTYVWYVANEGESGCNSARVPDSLVIRYTAHISLTSNPDSLTQDTCQYENIKPITFSFDGDTVPEVIGTLPAGVQAVTNTSAHTFIISGAPTEVGEFDFKVKLQNTFCSQPTEFPCHLTVHYSPRSTVYFTSCNHEPKTIGEGAEARTFNTPGTYQVRLSSSLGCDSIVTLIYNDYDYNQFGYEDNNVVLANWSNFRDVRSPINSNNNNSVYGGNTSQISYSGWNYSWSYRSRERVNCNISSGSNFIVGTNDYSLALPSAGAKGESSTTAGTSNGKSIVLKTKTKNYGQLSLQMDYQTNTDRGTSNQSLSIITIEYSTDSLNWSGSGIEVQDLPKTDEGGTQTGTLTVSNLPMAMNDKEELYIRLTFDGAATAVQTYVGNFDLLLDNITISGHEGITDVQLVEYPSDVCKNHLATIVASEPYVECDEDSTLCDTSVVYYHWTKTVGDNTTELEELGNTLVVPITENATYTVTVGTQENCHSTASQTISVLEPIDSYTTITRTQDWCANDLDNFLFKDSESGESVEGARISYPSIDSLSKKPGVYDCRLSIPSETACDSIIHLQLTVLKSFDTTIYAAICLGSTYEENGFNVSPDSVGSYTFTHSGFCSTGCDSNVTLHLTVNSVEHTLTSYDDVLMVAWPLNGGPKKLTPQCGEESVMRSAVLTFEGPNGFKAITAEEGSTLSSAVCPAATNSAIALYNGIGKSHYALEAEAWTSLDSTSVLVKLNPTDYEPLKLSFDYNKSIDPVNAQYTGVLNSFTNVSCYYSYGDGNFVRLGTPVSLQTGRTENYKTQWRNIEFNLSRLHTLDSAELDIKLVFTGGNKGRGESHSYGLNYVRYRYFPAYLNIDNLVVIGDKPARAKLLANVPYATYVKPGELASSTAHNGDTVAICKGTQITFTSQKDDAYFKFFLEYPDGTQYPFNGSTTIAKPPKETGYYNIIAKDNNGCDSVFKFYVEVNDYPIISSCTAPSICTDAPFAFVPEGADTNVRYSWPAPSNQAIDNATLKIGDHQDSLRAQLINLTDTTVPIQYTLTPYMGGCRGDNFTVDFKVFPQVQISEVTASTNYDGCPGQDRNCTIHLKYLKYLPELSTDEPRRMIWEINDLIDTVLFSESADELDRAHTITLPASPCDTSYKVFATYMDGAGCIAKDTITLTVNIPAHEFTIADADADSIVYCLNHATEPDTSLVPEAYSGCGDTLKGVLVGTYVDSPTDITCEGTRTYTYKYTDCKGQDTTWDYVYKINHKAPELKPDSVWPVDIEGQDNLYADRDTSVLYSDDQVKALYQDNCGGNALTVTHIQVDSSTQNSGWKTTRIYTVVTACQDTVLPTMSVSGSDQTPPTPPSPESDPRVPIVDINCCKDAAYTTKPFDPAYAVLGYVDNDGGTVTAVKTDSTIIGDNCSWTITYTYKVVDACGNELPDQTYTVSGRDQDVPVLTGNMPDGQNDIDASIIEIPAASTKDAIKALFTDCSNVINVDSTRNVTGNDCAWTAKFCYEIKDQCGNTAFDTITYTGGDHKKPTYTHPADTTLYLSRTGEVDTTADALGVPTNVLDNSGKTPAVSHIDTKTDSCGISYSFDRTWHVKDSCGNDSVYVQKIEVKDTITPVVTTTVAEANAFRTIDGAYNLPNAFTTITDARVTVTGINIDPELEMTEIDTFNKNTCGLYVVRTYTVRDTCNDSTATFTHKILVKDTLTPRINGTWKNDTVYLTNVCGYTLPDTLKTVADVNAQKADFIKGLNLNPAITMTQDTTDKDGCGMFITRTYTVTDSCSGNSAKFTHKIVVKDTLTPSIAGNWEDSTVNMDVAGHYELPTKFTSVAALNAMRADFIQNCNINDHIELVSADTTGEGTCGLKVTRTYQVTDSCSSKSNTFTHTITVADTVKPVIADLTWDDDTVYLKIDTTYELPTEFVTIGDVNGKVANFITGNNLDPNLTMVADTQNRNTCGLQVVRTYTVRDTCNDSTATFTHTIVVKDTLTPAINGTWGDSTVYLTEDGTYTLPAAYATVAQLNELKPNFIKGPNLNAAVTFEADTNDDNSCALYVVRTYTITDSCSHKSDTFKHKINVSDTITPRIISNWAASTINMDAAGHYTLPAAFATVSEINTAYGSAFIKGNNLRAAVTMVADTQNRNTCGLQVLRTYTVTDSCNDKTNTFTHTITVADTVKPVIADLTWDDDTVYLKIDTTYELPTEFVTIGDVNGKVANFITGNNLDPNLSMVADTQNRNTCGLQVVRTYTVRDTCNDKDSSFTHTIVVKDTLTPAINGTLGDSTVYLSAACGYTLPNAFTTVSQLNTLNPNFISGPNIVENITLKEADTNAVGTCDWNVVRTYEVTDSCSNKTKSFTHTINVKDTIAPKLAEGKLWLKDSLYQNALFVAAYDAPLADDDSVKKLFFDCTELIVTHKDDTVLNDDCGWKIRRTYTITDDCGNKKVDSVFIGGGDQTKPTFTCPKDTILYLSDNCQVDTTPNSTKEPTDLADNSGVTPTVTHTNEAPVPVCGNTYYFYRVWTVTDACGNDSIQRQKITVEDSTKPAIAGTLTNDTVYLTGHSCSDYVLTAAMTTVGEVVDHSGDLTITDCNVSAATEVTAAEPATEYGQGTCDHYYVRTYTVTDSCNNSSTFTHKIVVMDTLTPSIAGNWTDSTVNMDAAGHYDLPAEFTSVAALNAMSENFIQNCNINDNIELVSADTTGEGTCGLKVTRTYQVTDSCSGKSKTFTHTITVGDTVKPVIQCKDVARSSYTNVGSDTYTKDSDSWNVTASDNNAIDTIYYNLSGATEGEGANTLNGVTFKTGMTLVTWTVKDVCGNDTTCTDTIKIINVNPITVYLSENSDTLVYDGQEHTLTGYVVDSISNDLYTDADFSLKASAINDTIVKGTLAGSYSMPLDNEDFENVSPYFKNIHFNVTSRDLVIKQNPAVITIASGSHTFDASEYDGQPHYFPSYVVKYNGETMPRTAQDSTKFVLPAGDTLSVTPTGYVIDARETAEHNNTFTWELQHADCYANEIDTNGLVGTIHFNAFPQPIVISSETMTWTYDGNAHSYPKYTVKFGDEYATRFEADTTKFILPITGDTVRIHSTASITDAGKVANTFTYTIDNDVIYVGERDTIVDTLYVLPLTGVVVTITENTDTVTYDGTPHSVTGYEVTHISSDLYDETYFSYSGQVADTTASGTYAGTYPMNVLPAQFANTNPNFTDVTFTIVDQDLVINPIQSNIQITAKSAEKNFDGTPLTEAGYTHTMNGNLVAGDTIVATVVGSRTAVGSSDNVVTAYYVLRKTSATTFDTITNCYTFADPATVNGTLRVNKALAIVSKDSVDVDCYGNHNGTATIVVEGGKLVNDKYEYTVAGPNSYSVIDSIGTTLELTGLYPGAYTVTFNDGLDSTLTATFSINEPDTLVAEITAPNALCPNQGSYRVSVTVNGGNGTNAYVWGSNATNVNATSTVVAQIGASDCGTEYTAAVKVTDAKGCVAKDTVKFTVDDNEAPTFTAPANITLCRNADGQIEAPISVTGVPTDYSDNCSNEATMIRHTTFRDIDTTGTLNTLMVIRREWTVTDSCENSVADTQRISIKPSIAGSDYVLTAPADIEVTLRYGAVDTLLENIGMAVATNIPQGIATPEITNNKPENDRYPEGINYVVWTATDECGFTVVDTQTIIVNYPPCDPVTYYGYEYPAVRIGGNCWLAENLHNTQYADNANIPEYSSYNNNGNMTGNYGLLYTWYSAVRVPEGNDNAVAPLTNGYVQGVCPDGWAIPTDADYNALFSVVGSTNVLKDVDTRFWLPGAAGTTPNTGFNARGAGFYDETTGRYMNLLGETYFWTSNTGAIVSQGKCSAITHYCPEMINYSQDKHNGYSVRCIRKE